MSRQPSTSYMKFVDSVARKMLDPETTVAVTPKHPKRAKIITRKGKGHQMSAGSSYESSSYASAGSSSS
jgi:hypothetical protein